jgi:glucokinase
VPANVVGIDLGGTKIAAARFDDEFNLLAAARVPTPPRADQLPSTIIGLARQVWHPDVIAAGVGVAGLVRWPEGVLAWVPHVEGAGVDLRGSLGEALRVPVVVDHDANVAALAEFEFGAGQGYNGGLLVTVGTGIGAAIIIEGEVYRGRSFAGEVGHMRVVADGIECPCGKTGCWETLASGTALARLAADEVERNPDGVIGTLADGQEARGEDVTAAAAAGDEVAQQLLARVATWFGIGLGNLISALDPEVIIVGGGLGSVGDPFLAPVRATVESRLYAADYRTRTPILGSEFGAEAGFVGASLAAWRSVSWRFRFRERRRRWTETLRNLEPERERRQTRRGSGA